MNAMKTALLLGLLSGLLIVGGGAIDGERGPAYGLIMAVAMNFFSYFFSEKMALMPARAQRVSETEYPEIYARLKPIIGTLVQRMGIPMPKLWVTPDLSPNAFATGRNPKHASVAVTSGILQLMNKDELAAVLAHELGHVKNRDILISSVAATLASAITYLARTAMWFGCERREEPGRRDRSPVGGLLMIFLAPLAAGLIRMAISRTREFSADATSARTLGTAQPMISSLEKLDSVGRQIPLQASPSMSHMYIMQPFSGTALFKLFSTHPPLRSELLRCALWEGSQGTQELQRSLDAVEACPRRRTLREDLTRVGFLKADTEITAATKNLQISKRCDRSRLQRSGLVARSTQPLNP